MWDRIHRLKIAMPPEVNKDEVDEAFEAETGKDCDVAADEKVMNDADFRRAIQKTFEKLRKKKTKENRVPIEVAA